MSRLLLLASLTLGFPAAVHAQTFALIDEVHWPSFRLQIQQLLTHCEKLDGVLPPATVRAVSELLTRERPDNPRLAARAVQKLLDPHALIGVHINPESRVKAARGDRPATLTLDKPAHVLVRVHNEGGVTHPLSVASDQAILPRHPDPDRWLQLRVLNDKPFANRLSGQLLEYRVLQLLPRQVGKREATLTFDVGQGTQDLGFRSEVPILFSIRRP